MLYGSVQKANYKVCNLLLNNMGHSFVVLVLLLRRHVDGGAATANNDNVYISIAVVFALGASAACSCCIGIELVFYELVTGDSLEAWYPPERCRDRWSVEE